MHTLLTETKCDRGLHQLHAKLPQNLKFNHNYDVQLIVLFTPSYWVLTKTRKNYITNKDSCYFLKLFFLITCNKYYHIKNSVATEKDTFALIIEILKTPWSLIADVYEHVYVHASVYVLAAARASLACLPLTVLRVMLMMNTVLMRRIVSSHLINRAIRKPRKGKIAQMCIGNIKISRKAMWEK